MGRLGPARARAGFGAQLRLRDDEGAARWAVTPLSRCCDVRPYGRLVGNLGGDPIQLYLIRHGIAADRGPDYPDDSHRPLTEVGVARMRLEAVALAALGVSFDHIISSPLVRARQTADIVAGDGAPSTSVPVTDSEALAFDGTPDDVRQVLARYPDAGSIALVGHEPNIGELAGALTGARWPLRFKKGAVCRIDVTGNHHGPPGELRWFLTPRMLRIIGRSATVGDTVPAPTVESPDLRR